MSLQEDPFFRHILQCNKLSHKKRLPVFLDRIYSGWIDNKTALLPPFSEDTPYQGGINFKDPTSLETCDKKLCEEGYVHSLHEAFDVRPSPHDDVFGHVDRGCIPIFGFIAQGVHLNGLVRKASGLHLWVGRRAADKKLDPGKLDHISAGGVPQGFSPHQAMIKEAFEEAGIPESLTQNATNEAHIVYALDRPEGLRRDILYCYDLYLDEAFTPTINDGEVDSFELMPVEEVYQIVKETDAFKFNVNLAHIDLFLRHGLIAPKSKIGEALRHALNRGLNPLAAGRSLEDALSFLP